MHCLTIPSGLKELNPYEFMDAAKSHVCRHGNARADEGRESSAGPSASQKQSGTTVERWIRTGQTVLTREFAVGPPSGTTFEQRSRSASHRATRAGVSQYAEQMFKSQDGPLFLDANEAILR